MVKGDSKREVERKTISGAIESMTADKILPGHCIKLTDNQMVPADCFVVSLDNGELVVDESMLTGESIAVTKTPINTSSYARTNDGAIDLDQTKLHMVHAGTKILSVRGEVYGVVFRTGFNTSKGSLIRSILFPKPLNIKFERDGIKFIGIMAIVALGGFIFSTVVSTAACLSAGAIALKSLDIITIIVPPALPAALGVGLVYAKFRLKKTGIYTTQPQRINLAGGINLALFDKTGTLTESGLSLVGVKEMIDNQLSSLKLENFQSIITEYILTACHSLTKIENEILGDPLEIETFLKSAAREFDAKEGTFITKNKSKLKKIESFSFSSEVARQSVVIEVANEQFVLTKGAPEVIAQLCCPETLPDNFASELSNISDGTRVLAMAYKKLDKTQTDLSREECEKDLDFVGFLVFKNNLKHDSKDVIAELSAAEIKSIMVTGDSLETAIGIGREVGMFDSNDENIQKPVIHNSEVIWQIIGMESKQASKEHFELNGLLFNLQMTSGPIVMTGEDFNWIKSNKAYLGGVLYFKVDL